MKRYHPIRFEVSGDLGMFADPTHGSEAASLPVPPPTACIGMIESVCWVPGVDVDIVAVALCRKPQWVSFAYNSHSPFRKRDTIESGTACQIREMVLWEPCFQIIAVLSNRRLEHGNSRAHSMHDRFWKRLARGQSFHATSLGRKEFLANYLGFPRTPVINYGSTIPIMCTRILDENSRIARAWRQNLEIKNGVLCFDQQIGATVSDGHLTFSDEALRKELDFQTMKWGRKVKC